MRKIIILGSNGQLGSDLVKLLNSKSNYRVISLTRNDIDASSFDIMQQLANYQDADYIINCIAITNVDGCEINPQATFVVNSGFATQLAQFCGQYQIKLIHISTDYVFAGDQYKFYTELDQAKPLNVYGLSKYLAELAIQQFAPKHFILRVSSLFGKAGASGKGGNFVTTMLRLAQEKSSWQVISDQVMCPTHTLDVARAINCLIELDYPEYGIFHCVSKNSSSWLEFAQEILRQNGNDPQKILPISYSEYKFKALRPQYSALATDKLAQIYQMPNYQDALSEYLALIK